MCDPMLRIPVSTQEPVRIKRPGIEPGDVVVKLAYWDQPSGASNTFSYTVPSGKRWSIRYIRAFFQVDIDDAPYISLSLSKANRPTHNINGMISSVVWGDSSNNIALTNDNEQACLQWTRGGVYCTYGTATIKTEQRYLPDEYMEQGDTLLIYVAGFVNLGTGVWITITIDEESI